MQFLCVYFWIAFSSCFPKVSAKTCLPFSVHERSQILCSQMKRESWRGGLYTIFLWRGGLFLCFLCFIPNSRFILNLHLIPPTLLSLVGKGKVLCFGIRKNPKGLCNISPDKFYSDLLIFQLLAFKSKSRWELFKNFKNNRHFTTKNNKIQ